MLNLPPEDDDDYEILEHANSLIESKNFDIFEWHQLLANADWDWSVEQLKIIESLCVKVNINQVTLCYSYS